jgi:RNA polymerase sigma factor (sigma-70 family)
VETNGLLSGKSLNEESAQRRTRLFNQYVFPHKSLIYSLCIRYSSSPGDIEDNYSEVLVNFFKYVETYDPSRSIQTWLHIVTKRFICEMNRRRRSFKRSGEVDISRLAASFSDEADAACNVMDMENYHLHYGDDVLKALQKLKPIYREALLLQQAGYKLEEIMEISFRNGNLKAKNLETVKSRLFLAKQQMRKLITRNGETRED